MATIQQTYKQVGKYFLNGKDMFTTFGVVFAEKAYAQLLKLPQSRDEYVQVFADQNGSQRPDPIFFQTLTHTLPFVIIGTDYNDILNKYEAFRNELLSITYHLLEVPRLGKLYRLRYSNMSDFDTAERIMDQGNMVFTFKIDFLNDTPTNNSIFRTAFEAAKAAGYDVDENMFDQAVSADLPYSYQKEAEVILAPGIKKTGFVAGVDRSGNIVEFTATRAGTATYIGKDGLLKTAVANEPRIDYRLGVARLLTESSSINLLLYSRTFSNPYWNTSNITETDNAVIGRDGMMSATKCVIDSSAAAFIYNTTPIPVSSGNIVTFSFWAKKGTKQNGYILTVLDGDNTSLIILPSYDYSTSINDKTWSQVKATFIIPSGTSNIRVYIHRSASETPGLTFFITDAQVEFAASPTSTIVTNGAIGVRATDVCTELIPSAVMAPATLFMDVASIKYSPTVSHRLLVKQNNAYYIYRTDETGMKAYDGATISSVASLANKIIASFDSTKKNIYADGIAGNETTVDLSTYQQAAPLLINDQGGTSMIRCLAIFSRRFTDQEAQSLTK